LSFSFDAADLQVIRLDVYTGGGVEYDVHLLDPFGERLAVFESRGGTLEESVSEITLPYRGEYRLTLTPVFGEAAARVVVTALDASGGGGVVTVGGEPVRAAMTTARAYHTYRVRLARGDVVTFAVQAAEDGDVLLGMSLYGPDGALLSEATNEEGEAAAITGVVAPWDGDYVVLVGNRQGTRGGYEFAAASDSVPPPLAEAAELAYNREYRAGFYEGDLLTASFDGSQGDVLRVEIIEAEPTVGVDIRLYSPYGEVVAYAVGTQPGELASIREAQLPYTGRYYLAFTWVGTGQAAFRLAALPVESLSGGGQFGEEHQVFSDGTLEGSGVFHTYQFTGAAGDRISISVAVRRHTGELTPVMTLLGPDGRQLLAMSDTGEEPEEISLENYELTRTGTHTLLIYGIGAGRVVYSLDFLREE
jgi:hypothetical protein